MTLPETFNFELVSPEARLVSEPATMAIIPGEEGEFGVLPGHTSLVATVRPGVVTVHRPGYSEPQRIFIAGGFADVSATNCTVLAEEAVSIEDLNAAALEQSLRDLREDLALAKDDFERIRLERKIALVKAKLEAVTGTFIL